MKKKLILAIAASAMALSLAIGGTMMMFNQRTDTATNTMTIGNGLAIELWESGTKGDGTVVANTKVEEGVFDGISFGTLAPGQEVDKVPTVKQTAGQASYLRVAAQITGTAADADLETIWANIGAQLGANWEYVANTDSLTSGYYYYVVGGAAEPTNLKEFTEGVTTAPLFKTVTIPATIENGDDSVNTDISIELCAQAIQAQGFGATAADRAATFASLPWPF